MTDESLSKGIFDVSDLENEIKVDKHSAVTFKAIIKERQRLKAEVEKVLDSLMRETGERVGLGKNDVLIDPKELKKRLGI